MLLISKGDSFCCSSVQCLTAATCTKRSPAAASSDLGSRRPSVVVAAAGCGFFALLLLIILLLQMLQLQVSTHTRTRSLNHTLFLHQPAHTHSRALSLSVSSLSLSLSLARSLAHPFSVSHVCMYNFSRTPAYSLKLHTLALSPSRLSALSLTCCLLRALSPSQTFKYVPFITFYIRICTRHTNSWLNGRTSI